MKLPVLTYHSSNGRGLDYQTNDHIALLADLRLIAKLGWRVVPLSWVVEQRLGKVNRDLTRSVALSCDDGCDLDVRDAVYPGAGMQRSFLGCLQDVRQEFECYQRQPPHMTSFVIADAHARALMDIHCLHNLSWLNEDWWHEAAAREQFSVACHSWDHNHPVLGELDVDGKPRGDFFHIDSSDEAKRQIDDALDYINQKIAPQHCRYFAYPYGNVNSFLDEHYFHDNAARLQLEAAFGTQGEPVTMESPVWSLPRYVCGWHWKSPAELEALLISLQQA